MRVPYYYIIRVRGRGPKTAIKHKNPVFAEKGSKKVKISSADNQAVTKKMHFLCNFFAKIFGHIKKKQYFCIRFRSKNG